MSYMNEFKVDGNVSRAFQTHTFFWEEKDIKIKIYKIFEESFSPSQPEWVQKVEKKGSFK